MQEHIATTPRPVLPVRSPLSTPVPIVRRPPVSVPVCPACGEAAEARAAALQRWLDLSA